jgi:hypothetical protein
MTSRHVSATADLQPSDSCAAEPEFGRCIPTARWSVAVFTATEFFFTLCGLLLIALFAVDCGRKASQSDADWWLIGIACVAGAVFGLLLCGAAIKMTGWLYRGVRAMFMSIAARSLLASLRKEASEELAAGASSDVRWNNPWPGAAVISLRGRMLIVADVQTRYRVLQLPLTSVVATSLRCDREMSAHTRSSPLFFFRLSNTLSWSPGFTSRTQVVSVERATLEVQYEPVPGTVLHTLLIHFGADVQAADRWLTMMRSA